MANWCENYLDITGDKESVAMFKEKAKGNDTDLSLDNLYPLLVPFSEDVTNWCFEHWGTGWDIGANLYSDESTALSYQFLSLSSPPVAWLQKVSKDFPTLSFRLKYDEGNTGLHGIATAENGVVNDRKLEVN